MGSERAANYDLNASLIFSPAPLRLPTVWSFFPSAFHSWLAVAFPRASLALPLSTWDLLSILSSADTQRLLAGWTVGQPRITPAICDSINSGLELRGVAGAQDDVEGAAPPVEGDPPDLGAPSGCAGDQLVRARLGGLESVAAVGGAVGPGGLVPRLVHEGEHRPGHGLAVLGTHHPAGDLGHGPARLVVGSVVAVGSVVVVGGVAVVGSGGVGRLVLGSLGRARAGRRCRRLVVSRRRGGGAAPAGDAGADEGGDAHQEREDDETDGDHEPGADRRRPVAPAGGQRPEEDRADRRDADRRPDALAGLQHPGRRAALAGGALLEGERLVGRDDEAAADARDEQRDRDRPP